MPSLATEISKQQKSAGNISRKTMISLIALLGSPKGKLLTSQKSGTMVAVDSSYVEKAARQLKSLRQAPCLSL